MSFTEPLGLRDMPMTSPEALNTILLQMEVPNPYVSASGGPLVPDDKLPACPVCHATMATVSLSYEVTVWTHRRVGTVRGDTHYRRQIGPPNFNGKSEGVRGPVVVHCPSCQATLDWKVSWREEDDSYLVEIPESVLAVALL